MSDENKALVRKIYDEVLNPRNLDAIETYVADSQLVENIRRGCFVLYGAFPDLHSSIEEIVAEGDKVFLRATSTGTHDGEWMGIPASGRHVAFEYAEVYGVADGMVVSYWCLPDMAGLMRQLTEEPVATA
ncbi:MAG TPA: ester cyclase [Gaiellaceae bacterium]|nr:ester cyclase [Gaiellaceae bacterium]